MKPITLGLFLLAACFSWGQKNFDTSELILNNGARMTIRGTYEIFNDEVHFMDLKGNKIVVPISKVNLKATEEANISLQKQREVTDIVDDGTLYNDVKRWKKQQNMEMYEKTPKMSPEEMAANFPEAQNGQEQIFPDLENMDDIDQLPQNVSKFMETLKNGEGPFIWMIWVFLGLLFITGLISFFTQIYLLIISYRENILWGLTLTFGMFGPSVLTFMGMLLVSALASLVGFFAIIFFISFNCDGSRLKLFLLWLSPIVVLLIGLPILFITGVFSGLST